jgi:hypothetical protein
VIGSTEWFLPAFSRLMVCCRRTTFDGYPNLATEEVVRDIADVTRPYLNSFPRERIASPRERRMHAMREHAASESSSRSTVLDANTQLQLIFQYYCKFGRTGSKGDEQMTIDSFNFMKFARECPSLLDSRLDHTEVDLIFTKCRAKHKRRLTYRQFLDALSAMAITKYPAEDPVTAFSLLLSHHVFHCAAAVGLREARVLQAKADVLRAEAVGYTMAEAEEASSTEDAVDARTRAKIARESLGSARLTSAVYVSEPEEAHRTSRLAPQVGDAPVLHAAPASAHVSKSTRSATPPRPGTAAPFLSPTAAGAVHQMRRVEDLAAERAAAEARGRERAVVVPPPPVPSEGDERSERGAFSRALMTRRGSVDDPEAPLERDHHFRGRIRERPSKYALGHPGFRATLAGEANSPGSVFDRLSTPTNFTGVYRRAFFTDGRMNAYADTGVSSIPTRFRGNTNTSTNETIHNISVTLRPNLRSGKSFK